MPDEQSCVDQLMREGETLEDLQLNGLRILQRRGGFRYGMDAVLLSDFARVPPRAHVADFGTGTGILPLLLYGRGKGASFDAFEIQAEMAEMAQRSMRINALEDTVRVHCLSVTHAPELLGRGSVNAIVCNPPYGVHGAALKNPSEALRLARHQDEDGLLGWFRAAHALLTGKGRMALIYPAPRMLELMRQMEQAHITPKRFRLVYPRADQPANLVLLEGVKDAKPMLHPEPPLIVYEMDGAPTAELRRIYHQTL